MDFVTDRLAIGTFLEARDAAALEQAGIAGVLCLARDRVNPDPIAGVEQDAWPLIDGEGNHSADLEGALRKLARLLARHDRVLVHCNAGRSRSCALVAAWLVRSGGLALDDALARVAARRPGMAIAPGLIDLLEACL